MELSSICSMVMFLARMVLGSLKSETPEFDFGILEQ